MSIEAPRRTTGNSTGTPPEYPAKQQIPPTFRRARRLRVAKPVFFAAIAGAVALVTAPTVNAVLGGGPSGAQDRVVAAAATQSASPAASLPPGSDAAAAATAAAETPAPDPAAGTPTAPAAAPATAPAAPAPIALAPVGGAATVAANTNCTLVVPADPLTAKGLATPYPLVATDPAEGPCREATAASSAFVQAAIVTARGRVTLYNPLVVDQGQAPGATPARAIVPPGATVGIWFGSNGDSLTLRSADGTASLAQGKCVNGSGTSIFGQFAYCNAAAFFAAAHSAIRSGELRVPRLGLARDGLPCPTVRDFSVVDQDQSDNVNTHYLATSDGSTAQPNSAAAAAVGSSAKDLANGSDNRLLAEYILPTLGCRTFTRPDQSNDAKATASLPLQELEASLRQGSPVALVPLSDPMTLENGASSVEKTNLFRIGVDQPLVGRGDSGDPAAYCRGIFSNPRGFARVIKAQAIYAQGKSPNATSASNLFTFLAARASDTFENLGCGALLNEANPVHLTMDAAGKVTAATFDGATPVAGAAGQPDPAASGAPTPTAVAGSPAPSPSASSPAPTSSATGVPSTDGFVRQVRGGNRYYSPRPTSTR